MNTLSTKNDFRETPVLILGYSRIEEIEQSVIDLYTLGVKRIFLSLDYAENVLIRKKQYELIKSLREIITNKQNLDIWHRSRNHGIAAGIISGLDWFFKNCASGIVIEDDLKFNRDFLEFCTAELKANRENKDLLLISGSRFNAISQSGESELCNYPQIWGWASWSEKWLEIRDLILKPKNFQLFKHLNSHSGFFYSGAKRVQLGYIDTWDLPLAYEMIQERKFCLLPPVNLVTNVGFDKYATHTKEADFPLNHPLAQLPISYSAKRVRESCSIAKNNRFLEKVVFKVKRRHILSPLKLHSQFLFAPRKKRALKSLEARIQDAESHE